jgi:hypothetical protein
LRHKATSWNTRYNGGFRLPCSYEKVVAKDIYGGDAKERRRIKRAMPAMIVVFFLNYTF